MGSKPSAPDSGNQFVSRLDELFNMKYPLQRLAGLIDWGEIERSFSVSFTSGRGRPASPPRLVAGLLYLQTEAPIDPSTLRAGASALARKAWRPC